MRTWVVGMILAVGFICLPFSVGWAQGGQEGQAAIVEVVRLWNILRTVDPDTPEYLSARSELGARVGALSAADMTEAAVSLMDPKADDGINALAIEMLLRSSPLPEQEIRRMLWDADRSFRHRVLLRCYYGFLRRDCFRSPLKEDTARRLTELLAERLASSAGRNADYGEQRLLVHLASAAMSRYARREDEVPAAKRFVAAMESYAASAAEGDALAASIRGWQAMAKGPETPVNSVESALAAMGHWEPITRYQAAQHLGQRLEQDPSMARQVWAALSDPRDEVRQTALQAFSLAPARKDAALVRKAADMLLQDPGVVVQAAAAETLRSLATQAQEVIESLLVAFEVRKLGPQRASSILLALSGLAGQADERQRRSILALAAHNLPASPEGALAALESLGPVAAPAIPQILAYRKTADRFMRQYVDNHVLPAISRKRVES